MKRIYIIQKQIGYNLIDIAEGKKLLIIGKKIAGISSPINLINTIKIKNERSIMSSSHYVVSLEEDPETGDLLLPLPVDLLNQMGWTEGTELWWDVDEQGKITLKKVEDEKLDDSLSS
jgi:hypothetical protein